MVFYHLVPNIRGLGVSLSWSCLDNIRQNSVGQIEESGLHVPEISCPRHTLFPDTHLHPTHTCIRHTLAPDTHLHPTHTCTQDTLQNFSKKFKKFKISKFSVNPTHIFPMLSECVSHKSSTATS